MTSAAMYRIPAAMKVLGLGRSKLYQQIKAGRIRTVHEGRTCLITASAIADYVALLEREGTTKEAA